MTLSTTTSSSSSTRLAGLPHDGARQTVLHTVQRPERQAIHVTRGRRKGLAIEVPAARIDLRLEQRGGELLVLGRRTTSTP